MGIGEFIIENCSVLLLELGLFGHSESQKCNQIKITGEIP